MQFRIPSLALSRSRGSRRLVLVLALAAVMLMSVTAAFAQTPVPMDTSDYITEAQNVMTTFNLFPLITVAAIISIAAYIVKRMRSAAR